MTEKSKISMGPFMIAVLGIVAMVFIADSQIPKPTRVKSDVSPKPAASTLVAPTTEVSPPPPPRSVPQNSSSSSTSASVSNHSSSSVSVNNSSSQTSSSGGSLITLNSVTVNGSTVTLNASTHPGATCTVNTNGPGSPGNFSRTADTKGVLNLNWAAASGSWNIAVQCGSASASTQVTVP